MPAAAMVNTSGSNGLTPKSSDRIGHRNSHLAIASHIHSLEVIRHDHQPPGIGKG